PKVKGMGEEIATAKFDLALLLTEARDGITGCLEYSRDLYEGETIGRMARHYERLVAEVVRDVEQRIQEIELMGEAEKRQLIEEWTGTEGEFGEAGLAQEMIAEQAERRGEAIAVKSVRGALSYGELNRRANHLGNYLKRKGIGREDLVG